MLGEMVQSGWWRGSVSTALFWAALLGGGGQPATAQQRQMCPQVADAPRPLRRVAFLLGVSKFADFETMWLRYAASDAKRLESILGSHFDAAKNDWLVTLSGADATRASVHACLSALRRKSGPATQFTFFVSTRGLFVSGYGVEDGILLTSDTDSEKFQQHLAALSSTDTNKVDSVIAVGGLIAGLQAFRNVTLYLDISRDPLPSRGQSNPINTLVQERRRATRFDAEMVFATENNARSREVESSRLGYYAENLGETLEDCLPQCLGDVSGVFDALYGRMKDVQKPSRTGSGTASTRARAAPRVFAGLWRLALARARVGAPIALALAAAMPQDEDPLARTRVRIREGDAGESEFAGWADAGDLLDMAIVAESAAEEVFVRYGEGNHFPGDPFQACGEGGWSPPPAYGPALEQSKLCAEDYRRAAQQYRLAEALYQSAWSGIEGGLEARDRARMALMREKAAFCAARAEILDGRPESGRTLLQGEPQPGVADWKVVQDPALAETYNARGVAALELALSNPDETARNPLFEEAADNFERATALAPLWAYPLHNLALVRTELGEYVEAEQSYRTAIERSPKIWRNLGDEDRERIGRRMAPCSVGRRAIVSARPYLHHNLAVLLHRLNRLQEAGREYCFAQASFLAQADGFEQKAKLPGVDDQTKKRLVLRAFGAFANSTEVNNSIAALLHSRDKLDNAERRYRHSLAQENAYTFDGVPFPMPDDKLDPARFNLAQLYRGRGDASYEGLLSLAAAHGYEPAVQLTERLRDGRSGEHDR